MTLGDELRRYLTRKEELLVVGPVRPPVVGGDEDASAREEELGEC